MFYVDSVFLISVYCLTCLAGLMLGFAEGAAFPHGVTLPLAVLSFCFTEHWKKLRLPISVANVLGVLAFLFASSELLTGDIEARLLSGAHLLSYLTWIVLFLEKRSREFWWLCALGVLQVAVGSVLTTAGTYGTLLAAYYFLAIWTLSVFSLFEARLRFRNTVPLQPATAGVLSSSNGNGNFLRDFSVSQQTATVIQPFSFHERSAVQSVLPHGMQERWINARFVSGIFLVGVLSLIVAGLFFAFVPRRWIGKIPFSPDLPGESMVALTGFTEEVQIGDLGQILESTAPVLEVHCVDNQTDETIKIEEYANALGYDGPLFRGTVFGVYQNGRWSSGNIGGRPSRSPVNTKKPSIRQEIELEPIGAQVLFAMHPATGGFLSDPRQLLPIQRGNSVFLRPRDIPRTKRISYVVYAPHPTAGKKMPHVRRGFPPQAEAILLRHYRQLPATGLERLIALSRRISGVESDRPPPSQFVMAERLEQYLSESGQFSYSLNQAISDNTIDPIEDFLFNRKTGHCEYFASALTLMLRAVDIPSRLVSGFKGGNTNRFTGTLKVQQRHAHAWVEAFIDGDWYVFDATPAAGRTKSVESMASHWQSWRDFVRTFDDMWTVSVLNISYTQQRRLLYKPMQIFLADIWDSTADVTSLIPTSVEAIRKTLVSPRKWFSLQGVVLWGMIVTAAAVFVWFVRSLRGRLGSRGVLLSDRNLKTQRRVEFYERFQTICRNCGLVRNRSQTQQEFAADVRRSLNDMLKSSGLSEIPGDVVETFYRVRFGAAKLDSASTANVDRSLTALEQCLKASNDVLR